MIKQTHSKTNTNVVSEADFNFKYTSIKRG